MNFSVGVIIFFLALIALVAEVVLYFVFGIGATFSSEMPAIGDISAFFFVSITGLAAVGAGVLVNQFVFLLRVFDWKSALTLNLFEIENSDMFIVA